MKKQSLKIIKTLKTENSSDSDVQQDDSSVCSDHETITQEHARPRAKPVDNEISPHLSTSQMTTSMSQASISHSILKFRTDFEDLKCKMRIFGESLNLCRCIAHDFKNKLSAMEKRLQLLEKKQHLSRTESNYSAIINKNKLLSNKTLQDAKEELELSLTQFLKWLASLYCE